MVFGLDAPGWLCITLQPLPTGGAGTTNYPRMYAPVRLHYTDGHTEDMLSSADFAERLGVSLNQISYYKHLGCALQHGIERIEKLPRVIKRRDQ